MAVPFDVESLEVCGTERPVQDNVLRDEFGVPQVAITADGTLYYRSSRGQESLYAIYRDPLDGEPRSELYSKIVGYFYDFHPSPDGRYVAYTSRISGESQVYVRPFDSRVGGETQVSSDGGDNAMWSPDGQRLFFTKQTIVGNYSISLKVVEFGSGPVGADEESPGFSIGDAQQLLQLDVAPSSWARWQKLQIMPDGESLLRIGLETQQDNPNSVDDPAVIHVTQNLFTELERLAPTKRPTE